jgi:hypothetical protein
MHPPLFFVPDRRIGERVATAHPAPMIGDQWAMADYCAWSEPNPSGPKA